MLPDGETYRLERVGAQGRLGEQARQVTRQDVAGAALSQMRIAGGIDMDNIRAAADEGLMAFENDPGVAKAFGDSA